MEITEDAQAGTTTFVIYMGGDGYSAPVVWRSVQGGNATEEFLYLHRDHLGSIVAITDVNGAVKEKRHFDAWGNLAKLQDGGGAPLSSFIYLQRGYTGHEHLQGVGLIHMNGRLYDPLLHRFLMPDNYVQDPTNSQNFNRYGYVLNNPLRYTDPTGELTQKEFNTIVTDLWNKGGGNWNASRGSSLYGGDEGFAHGVAYMNQFNMWGGGSGWAGSPEDALQKYLASGASEGKIKFSYINDSGLASFLDDHFHGNIYLDNGYGEPYNFNGIDVGGYLVPFNIGNSSKSSGDLLGWVQTGFDFLGSTEIPFISQLGDLGSGIVSLTQGDYPGALLSAGGMIIPGLSQAKLGLKVVNRSESVLGHIFRNAPNHVKPSTVTSQNRYLNLFEKVANNPANLNPNVLNNFQRTAGGFEGYSQTFRNGKQVWTQTLNGKIFDAGVNNIPR